ncbi:homoserine dehydrogenase [Paenibacillus lautus]|jgi:homoserine dehydrogenase|uniref:Homoserine dehydrogenase n=1 Tax=Paenibacillus lautus TaxID=1401 RepID=A0A385TPS5_PAELA|nr:MULTISPECIES: homoserine dehydrogenase [Paenibacillus]MBY0164820.1 homoserine dehydrogenase [Cytobacillus firmus]VTR63335.1 bifunctional aspartokinase I/homoserine dehydrogenase I [Actinobacillus pleuropneumoniae]AYB45789.1 homoserine dehydrogenase [Paenibacillus lautus]MCI1776851.1 homoserine dehydrogenase [Paenibacillus lautus]SEL64293.1 homoserine dehydrogenase [Paenibacillus sp. cl141a]
MKPVKVGLLGLGTVGTGVVRIVEGHQEDLSSQVGSPITIERIAVKHLEKYRSVNVDQSKLTEDPWAVIRDPEIDVIVEVMGGIEQTKTYILEALERGKHIVTANKDLMALHGAEILAKAQEKQCDVFYEASVAGGIPIIRTLIEGFSSDRIMKIMGIVNGTTNFILTKMSQEGASYEDVLAEAQELGYAEADPTSDVEGLDAARKMAILGTLGFRTNVELQDVSVKGISQVTKEDIAYAKRLGYEMKLLGIAERQDDEFSISVQPTMVRKGHPIAAVNGVFNAVYVYGEAVGETMFYGAGAGEMPTATSVVADLVAVIKNLKLGVNGLKAIVPYKPKKLKTDEQIMYKNFILLHVDDKAGVLAQITQVFAQYNVSLESVVQQPNEHNPDAEIIIVTHNASKASMDEVLNHFEGLEVIRRIKSVYRVEG